MAQSTDPASPGPPIPPVLTCPSCRTALRPQAIRCPRCLTDIRGSPASGAPQPTLDPWSEPVARAADPGHGLATVAFVIGVASLLWELVGGVILPPLATAALREQAQGQAVAMLHLLVGAAAGLAPIVGLLIAVVLGHRALRRIRSAGTDMGGIIWATAATVTGWVGIGQLLVGLVLIPFSGPFHNLVDQLRMLR